MTNLSIGKHLYSALDGYYATAPFSQLTMDQGGIFHYIQLLFCSNVLSRITGGPIPHTMKISLLVPIGTKLLGKMKRFEALSDQINRHLSKVITAVMVVSLAYLFYQGEQIYAGVALAGMAARFAFCKSARYGKIEMVASSFSKLLIGPKFIKLMALSDLISTFSPDDRWLNQQIAYYFNIQAIDDSGKVPSTKEISKSEMEQIFELEEKVLAKKLEVEKAHIHFKQQRDLIRKIQKLSEDEQKKISKEDSIEIERELEVEKVHGDDLEEKILQVLEDQRNNILKEWFTQIFPFDINDHLFNRFLFRIDADKRFGVPFKLTRRMPGLMHHYIPIFFLGKDKPLKYYFSPCIISGYFRLHANFDTNLIKNWWKQWIERECGNQAQEMIETLKKDNCLFGKNIIDGKNFNERFLIPILIEMEVFKINL
jgi:hypothetical protein